MLYVTDGVAMPATSLQAMPDVQLEDDDLSLLVTDAAAMHQVLIQRAAQRQVCRGGYAGSGA